MAYNPSSPNNPNGPRVIAANLAVSAHEYLMRLQELGAMQDNSGDLVFAPEVRPVLEALHTVLAGGQVTLNIVNRGNPDIINELNRRLDQANRDANAINRAAGFYLTATI
jgi:hypothetical protein